jgi:hypothetical protein
LREKTPPGSLPEKAPSGLGKKSLAEISQIMDWRLMRSWKLCPGGTSRPERNELKQIGEALGKDPMEIYQILRINWRQKEHLKTIPVDSRQPFL